MPVLDLNADAGTFRHQCGRCGYQDDLHLDPAKEHVRVTGDGAVLMIRPCPHCAANATDADGNPLTVIEGLRLNMASWEAGEGPHPNSLVGTRLPGPRLVHADEGTVEQLINVVSEHTEGYHLGATARRAAQLHRAMQQHPHLAPHAPLRPDPPHLPGKVPRHDPNATAKP